MIPETRPTLCIHTLRVTVTFHSCPHLWTGSRPRSSLQRSGRPPSSRSPAPCSSCRLCSLVGSTDCPSQPAKARYPLHGSRRKCRRSCTITTHLGEAERLAGGDWRCAGDAGRVGIGGRVRAQLRGHEEDVLVGTAPHHVQRVLRVEGRLVRPGEAAGGEKRSENPPQYTAMMDGAFSPNTWLATRLIVR